MRRFEYRIAAGLDEALAAASRPGTVLKAGGVDLLDRMKEGIERPALVVGLQQVLPAGVAEEGGGLVLGAGTTLAELERSPLLRERAPALARAAGEAATPQIREMATLGGNLLQMPRCLYLRSRHYPCEATDPGGGCPAREGEHETHALFENEGCSAVHPSNVAPALLALEAEAEVAGPGGGRHVGLAAWLGAGAEEGGRRPGEILLGLRLPGRALGDRCAHAEVRARQSFDWPLAMAAANFNLEQPRLVLGAVAPRPWPVAAPELLREIRERGPEAELLERLVTRAAAGATPLPGNAWRLRLLRAAARRAVLQALHVAEETW